MINAIRKFVKEFKYQRAQGNTIANPLKILSRLIGLGFLYVGAAIKAIGHLFWADADAAKVEFDF